MVSATHARKSKNIDAEYLSNIWQILLEDAERKIDVTSQHVPRTGNPHLSWNYSLIDRALCYKRIKEHFFIDTFYATKKAGKSSCGNTCCQ
eukprot:7226573-Ditylum_brightwellii.AAC.1